MKTFISSLVLCEILFGALICANDCPAAEAPDRAAVLAPFVNDDTLGIAYVDIATAKASWTAGAILPLLPKGADTKPVMLGAMMADGMIHRFKEAGGESIYVVAGLGDIRAGGGPIGIATPRSGANAADLEKLFRDLIREVSPASGQSWELDVVRKGDAVLVGSKSSVARYAALKASPRNELIEPLAKLVNDGAKIAAVFCPGTDYRRVSRELWPEFPGALAPLRGELAVRWLRIELDVKPPRPRVSLIAKDAEAAEIFAKLWRDLPIATTEFGGNEQSREQAKGYAQLLVNSFSVKVEGTKATIELPADEKEIAKLRSMFGAAINASMETNRRKERISQFKQLALGILNYSDVNRHLPAVAAICDKDGKPLLSWRVAILPYIEQQPLYDAFHLDEPWDSPHNRTLIEKMPTMFVDSDPKLGQLRRAGKTMFQVPAGPETMFFNNEGATFKDIKDGISNTIMIVEVDPAHAVEWTKPADWEVDLKNPAQGVERPDRDFFTAAYADGHVEIITPKKASEKRLRAQFTRAGREIVDRQ